MSLASLWKSQKQGFPRSTFKPCLVSGTFCPRHQFEIMSMKTNPRHLFTASARASFLDEHPGCRSALVLASRLLASVAAFAIRAHGGTAAPANADWTTYLGDKERSH